MDTARVKKWGNSLALRITAVQARELGLKAGSSIKAKVEDGALVVTRVTEEPSFSRADLKKALKQLAGRTRLVDMGEPVGNELL